MPPAAVGADTARVGAALIYNGINGGIVRYRGGEDAPANSILSAALTGMIFKSTGRPRIMLLSGMLGALIATSVAVKERLDEGGSILPDLT